MNDDEIDFENLHEVLLNHVKDLDPGNYSVRVNIEHCAEHIHVRVYTEIGLIHVTIDRDDGSFFVDRMGEAVEVIGQSIVALH